MNTVICLWGLPAGFLISLFWRPAHQVVGILSKTYLWLVLSSVAGVWIFYFAGIRNATALRVINQELNWTCILRHSLLAYLLGTIAFGLKDVSAQIGALPATLNTTLWATSLSYGNTFILVTVGKYMNMPEMIAFFKQSGYTVLFLYFIMTAETIGAIGVLSHFRWKMGIQATIGLTLIMLGAVYTHWHNGDPLSDSYDAVSQLIMGSLLLILYSFERKLKRIAPKAELHPSFRA